MPDVLYASCPSPVHDLSELSALDSWDTGSLRPAFRMPLLLPPDVPLTIDHGELYQWSMMGSQSIMPDAEITDMNNVDSEQQQYEPQL